MNKSIIFFGTSEFAVTSLKTLLYNGINIKAVVTIPDKPAGRGKKILPSPVKIFASEKKLNLLQPENLNDAEFLNKIVSFNADLFVVVAFKKLPKEIWDIPPLKTINLHASLLPNYRGAAPINWVLINGETYTGVTTFIINENIDQGEIIMSEKVLIEENETFGELYNRLKTIGANLLLKTLIDIFNGKFTLKTQDNTIHNFNLNIAPKIRKNDCIIDWNKTSKAIFNLIRGLSPSPAANTTLKNFTTDEKIYLKILRAKSEKCNNKNVIIGDVITDNQSYMKIGASDGYVQIIEIQPSGKNRMSIDAFLRGNKLIGNWKAVF